MEVRREALHAESKRHQLYTQLGELELQVSEALLAGHVAGHGGGNHARHLARVVPGQERGISYQPQADARLLSAPSQASFRRPASAPQAQARRKRQHATTWIVRRIKPS